MKFADSVIKYLSIFIAIILLVFTFNLEDNKYFHCSVLISIYLSLYISSLHIYKYLNNVTAFFIFFLTTIRYFLMPILICIDDNYMTYCPLDCGINSKYFYCGLYFSIWEALFLFLFLKRQLPKWYPRYMMRPISFIHNENTTILLYEMGALFLLVALAPSVLDNFNFLFNLNQTEDFVEKSEEYVSLTQLVAVMAIRILKIISPIPIICWCYRKYQLNKSGKYFYVSAISLIVLYAMIMEGNSRNSIIIPAISLIFILATLYPIYKKRIWTVMCLIITIISIMSILFKVFGNDVVSMAEKSTLSYWISYLDVYFAGITNMGKVVIARMSTDLFFDPFMMLNDLTKSTPILSKFCNELNTSEFYYFKVWGRNDQIIPSSGNGLFYFGFIFAPIVPIIITKISHFFEVKANKAKYISLYIVYIYSSAVVGYNIFNSVSSLTMKLTITIMPVILAVHLNRNIQKRRLN